MDLIFKGDYHGGQRSDFTFEGHYSVIVKPAHTAPGAPWVWRAEFFDAFPAVDIALLDAGWHILYCSYSDMYGCPAAINGMKKFHDFAVKEFSLSSKAAVFGFSRGGLYTFNYALAYPDDVAAVYLDAPVLDLKRWPCGSGAWDKEKNQCFDCYGFSSDADLAAFTGNPVDRLAEFCALGLPTALVAGAADDVVPLKTNGALLAAAITDSDFIYIVKAGCKHWPHSLEDPTPVADFIKRAFAAQKVE